MILFEKERRQAEADLRRRLAVETEVALEQQEKALAVLMGRLEVFENIQFVLPPILVYKTSWFSYQIF